MAEMPDIIPAHQFIPDDQKPPNQQPYTQQPVNIPGTEGLDPSAHPQAFMGQMLGKTLGVGNDIQRAEGVDPTSSPVDLIGVGMGSWLGKGGAEIADNEIGSIGNRTLAKSPKGLPMDEASRMARAEKMGFDTANTLYHGTKGNISEFDPNLQGASSGTRASKQAFFFSDSPKIAEQFSKLSEPREILEARASREDALNLYNEYRQQIVEKYKKKNPAIDWDSGHALELISSPEKKKLDSLGDKLWSSGEKYEKLDRHYRDPKNIEEYDLHSGSNINAVHLRTEDPYIYDAKGQKYSQIPLSTVIQQAKDAGHDSVIFNNIIDAVKGKRQSSVTAVFDPSQIRSKFATFDPSKAGSGNLSAGIAGAVGAGGAAAQASEQPIQNFAGGGGVGQIPPDTIPANQFVPDEASAQQASASQVPDTIPANAFVADEEKYATTEQQIKTLLEGGAEAATFGLSTALERGAGVKPEDIQGRREINPGVHAIGQVGGLGLSSLIPVVGEANILRSVAGKAIGKLGLEGAGLLRGMTSGAGRAAVEMALFQAGDENSKFITGDPNQSAETALTNIGLSSLLGAVPGAAFGAVTPILEKLGATTTGEFVQDFKRGLQDHLDNPEPVPVIAKELQEFHGQITSAADDIYGAKGLKSQDIEKLMPPMNDTIMAQPNQVSDLITKSVQKMEAKPSIYGSRYSSVLEGINEDLQKGAGGLDKPSKVFSAIDEIKQKLGQYTDFRGKVSPDNPAYNGVREVNELYSKIKNTLQDKDIWGKAAERQQTINEAFSKFKPALQDFEKKFMTDVGGEKIIDQGKINTYVNQLGKPTAEIKQQMMSNFLEAAEKYKKVINDTHANLGIESPFTESSLNQTNKTVGEISSGAKLANVVVSKGLAKLAGKSLGAGIGGAAGSMAGSPWLGAILGEHALGPFFESVIPSLVKPILKNLPSGEGFQSAIQFGLAVTKGEAALNRAAISVFKPGSIVTPTRVPASDDKRTSRLDRKLEDLKTNTASLLNVGGQTGYYLPDHNSALSASAARATAYLQSLKPSEAKPGVLDPPRQPSQVEKARYNRALSVADNPLQVVDRIKEGTLTPADVMTLKTIYPNLHARISQKLTAEMIGHVSKGNLVPYQTRLGLSLFLGQPMDSTMTPSSIMALQPQTGPPQAQNSPQAPKSQGGTHSSMKELSKLPKTLTTPTQNREIDRRTS